MPEIGSQVGPYRIVQKLGRGGMGEVFQAWDTRLERHVALKFLDEPGGRFRIEAQAIAALQHPNVCAIFDIGPDYLVLEYLDGESPRGQIPENEISALLRQVVSALHAAHQRGILHRDLKPGNMMRLKDGTLKLLDFGLARRAGNDDVSATMTLAGSVVGTPAYMSLNGGDEPPVRGLGAVVATVGDYDWARGDELIRGAGGEVGANWGRLGHAIWGLRNRGLFREAQRVIDEVRALDPLSPFVSAAQQALLYQWRRFDECANLGVQMIGQLPAFWQAAWVACSALLAQQRWVESHQLLDRALAASPGQPVLLWTQAATFQREGRFAEFRQLRVRLEMDGVPLIPYLRSLLTLYQGDMEEAFDCLEASVELRDLSAGQLMLDHHWDSVRSHPRFQAILDRMNCPPHLRGPIPPEVFAA